MSVPSSHSASSRSVVVAKPQTVSTSLTRRNVVAGLALAAAPVTVLGAADNAHAQDKQTVPEKSTNGWVAFSPSRRWWTTLATPS
jgi:hypothetical protein